MYIDKHVLHLSDAITFEKDILFEGSNKEEFLESIQRLREHLTETGYAYEKNDHILANVLTILLPTNVTTGYDLIASTLVNGLHKSKYISSHHYVYRKGNGRYLQVLICTRKYKESKYKHQILYKSNVYQDKLTGRMCSAAHPNATLIKKRGEVKKEFTSTYSKATRWYAMSHSEFISFRRKLVALFLKALQTLKIERNNYNFFKTIKHKTHFLKGKKAIYVNINVNRYNDAIFEMNQKITKLRNIIYSEAKFYQESELTTAYIHLINRFQLYLKNQKFKLNDKVKLSISTFTRTDRFRENLDSFMEMFEDAYMKLISEWITGGTTW